MAEFLPPVIFEIQANATKAIAQMQTVNGELDKMEVKAIKAGGSLDVMTKASKFAGTALLGIAGVLGTVATVSIKAALSVQVSQSKLQTAVQNTGVSFQAFIPFMNQAQDSMAKLGFTAEDTNQALASMTAATRNPATAIENMGVVADLAAFKNESLAAAADTVSRATMGQARGLADLGLAIGKTIPKGADLATITQLVEQRVHGAAQAAANANPWKVLTTQFGVMEEKLGTALLPMFKKLSDWIITTGLPALEKIGKWISQNQGLFETLAGTLAALWVAPKIDALIASIGAIATAWGGVATSADAAATAEEAATGASATGGLGATILGTLGLGYLVKKQAIDPAKKALAPGGSATMSGFVSGSTAGMKPMTGPTKAYTDKYGDFINLFPGETLPPGYYPYNPSSSTKPSSSINSGLSNPIITTPAKGKAAKKPSIASQKAGIMGGGGALTLTITTDNSAIVKGITGSAGTTKVVIKK